MSERRERARRSVDRLHHVCVQGGEIRRRAPHHADPQRAGVGGRFLLVRPCRRGRGVRVAGRHALKHVEDRRGVSHRACQDVLDRQATHRFPEVGTGRHPAARGLQADEPACAGGDPDRAAAVGSVRSGHHAGSDRGSGATAGAAGDARRVPRVAGRSVRERLGRRDQPELGRVRPSDEDEARGAQARGHGAVVLCVPSEVAQEPHPEVERVARARAAEVLQHDRNAAERAVGQLGRRSGIHRLVEERMDDCIHLGVDLLDARDRCGDRLERRDLSVADQRRRRGRVEVGEIGHRVSATRTSSLEQTSAISGSTFATLNSCHSSGTLAQQSSITSTR